MERTPIILIYDKNPNIRGFLKRELGLRGYKVRIAKTPEELLKYVYWPFPPDAIVLDPHGVHTALTRFIREIDRRVPDLPILLHGFNVNEIMNYFERGNLIFIEKASTSIDIILNELNNLFDNS